MSQHPIRVACLGAGYFSQFHYDSWARLNDVALVGACDLDADKARATGIHAFEKLDALLRAVQPDILDIIVPPSGHADAIRTALKHGVRTLICQKPFCTSRDEAEALTRDAEDAGATLVIHENFRFQPWYRAVKSALDEGHIGEVLQATFRLRPGDGQGPQAYLDRQPYFQTMERFLVHETAVHWIDTFRFLFGQPSAVYADLRKVNQVIAGEDAGYILFDHPGGVRSIFDGNRSIDHAAENHRLTLGEGLFEGTEGVISLKGDGSLWLRRKGATEPHALMPAQQWMGFGGDCVHALQSHVVAHLRQGAPLENTARDYLKVIAIEEAIYASAELAWKVSVEDCDG